MARKVTRGHGNGKSTCSLENVCGLGTMADLPVPKINRKLHLVALTLIHRDSDFAGSCDRNRGRTLVDRHIQRDFVEGQDLASDGGLGEGGMRISRATHKESRGYQRQYHCGISGHSLRSCCDYNRIESSAPFQTGTIWKTRRA